MTGRASLCGVSFVFVRSVCVMCFTPFLFVCMGSLDSGMVATERRGGMGGREGGRFRVRSEDQSPRKEEERIKQTNKRTIQPIIISMWLINLLYYFCIHTCICSTRKGR